MLLQHAFDNFILVGFASIFNQLKVVFFDNSSFIVKHTCNLVLIFSLRKLYIAVAKFVSVGQPMLISAFEPSSARTHLLIVFIFRYVILALHVASMRFPYYLPTITKMVVFAKDSTLFHLIHTMR